MTPAESHESRRTEPRSRVLIAARAVFADGRQVVECWIRDLSAHGARLRVPQSAGLPLLFRLELCDRKQAHFAQLQWRRGEAAGVRFFSGKSPEDTEEAFQIALEIDALRFENEQLRKRERMILGRLEKLGYRPQDEFG